MDDIAVFTGNLGYGLLEFLSELKTGEIFIVQYLDDENDFVYSIEQKDNFDKIAVCFDLVIAKKIAWLIQEYS